MCYIITILDDVVYWHIQSSRTVRRCGTEDRGSNTGESYTVVCTMYVNCSWWKGSYAGIMVSIIGLPSTDNFEHNAHLRHTGMIEGIHGRDRVYMRV